MDKSYRIHTNIASDTVLNVNMKQDMDFLEVLSLKLGQKDAYRLHSSNYGVIIGRVLANDAFGVPNAKISVFIERDTNDSTDIENVYPYTKVTSKDKNSVRYNLLPDASDDDCYRIVGTFPNKRLLLDDDTYLEVYDKYWKYTTVTNNAGDYMLFAIPSGSQQIHVDLDLSDIGILSQKPRDLIYKGYNINEFDNANQFKESTNLDTLKQIITQDKSVFVYPFWGDIDNGVAAITRCDIQVNYKFEPTCVFMGSIVSDNEENAIGHRCAPEEDNGMNYQLVAGEGTIEMIRKTTDGLIEEYQIQGNRLIDSDGVWCYQIPMNLDYIGTDEYGNIVPTDNPNKGIPTRTQVRFRFSKIEGSDEAIARHTAKYLVPMNPMFKEDSIVPSSLLSGKEFEKMYNFGSNTPQSCFRDLYWNNVYSVKNYIPKTQVAHRAYSPRYSALKGSNLVDNQNPIPFNKLRVDVPFMFMIICILFTIILYIVAFINTFICTINLIIKFVNNVLNLCLPFHIGCIFSFMPDIPYIGCMTLGVGLADGNTAFYPGCWCHSTGLAEADCPEEIGDKCRKDDSTTNLKELIIENLAQEHQVVKLDLYQDWINGCLYMPLWYWRKSKKKTFLFGLFSSSAKNEFCDCDKKYSRLKTSVTCDIVYNGDSLEVDNSSVTDGEDKWHKKRSDSVRYRNGLIKGVTNKDGLKVYYYTAMQPTADNDEEPIEERESGFRAIRLYATDIILLGNLNKDNIYGIPQFFKALPSTTANIPAIATVEESLNDIDGDTKDTDIGEEEDSGTTVTTGMHWRGYGEDATPKYGTGLFFDLGCTFADTKAKSCINVERLSEYGVNLDMTHSVSYTDGNVKSIRTGLMSTDGFITKLELEDFENRSMFATLNHIGFTPQTYQDSINSYTTQVPDDNTNYLVPKFQFIYPVDFDGRMQPSMTRYKKSFQQAMYDEVDEGYLTFRLGARRRDKQSTSDKDKRIRHFYHVRGGKYNMPLYNNSYYFYFGINKGSTAIDKFNSMFMADCVQNSKDPFSFTISKRNKSYCYEAYNTTDKPYAYIEVETDDITKPYSYSLYNSVGTLVIHEDNMSDDSFTIGGGSDGRVKYHDGSGYVQNSYGDNGLENETYKLVLTDYNGKSLSQRVVLSIPVISMDYESFSLGTKYYNEELTSMDYICSEENDFYGRININGFTVDGYETTINSINDVKFANYDTINGRYGYIFTVRNEKVHIETDIMVYIDVINKTSTDEIQTCLCQDGMIDNVPKPRLKFKTESYVDDEGASKTRTYVQIDVYKPMSYAFTAYQLCGKDGKLVEETMFYDIVMVSNGMNFNTFLNSMPTLFMLGGNNEGTNMPIASSSKFYSLDVVKNPLDSHVSGWYGLHQETSYQFDRGTLQTTQQNQEVWKDFVSIPDGIIAPISKLSILKYKFNNMFSLSLGAYETGEFSMRAQGGIPPTLYRTVAPMYGGNDEDIKTMYEFMDSSNVTVYEDYPNIVGFNYSGATNTNTPIFNPLFNNNEYIGNYFAAFTNNGGYKNKRELDREMAVMRSPSNASVSPMNITTPKEMGKVKSGTITNNFKLVHTKGRQSLIGDRTRNVTPYLRALSVDRSIDYDLTFISPLTSKIYLYGQPRSEEEEYIEPWMGARICGTIYGGIEMSYDRDYNIISADTTWNADGQAIKATPNDRLEYSYKMSDGNENAVTVYNVASPNSIWEEVAYGTQKVDGEGNPMYDENNNPIYEEGKEPKDGQIIKRFYTALLGTRDLRNFFWSDFNKKNLEEYIDNHSWHDVSATTEPYVFSYPSEQTTYYNGDFNRDSVIQGNNYPTKRYIDICNIKSSGSYTFELYSCSYNTKTTLEEDETLTCEAAEGDGFEFDVSFEAPIEFVLEEKSDNLDYSYNNGHAMYSYRGGEFKCVQCKLRFYMTRKQTSNYAIYTAMPKVIQVLPKIGNVDGITYFKTSTPNGEIGAARNIDDAISDVTIYSFKGGIYGIAGLFFSRASDCELVDGLAILTVVKFNDRFFIDTEDNFKAITSDDARFDKNIFVSNLDMSRYELFSILVKRYYYDSLNPHIKKFRTIELSEFFDIRKCNIKCVSGNDNNPLSYVEGVTVYNESEESGTPVSSMTYAQTVTFEIKVNNDCCQTFLDYEMMTFTLLVNRIGRISSADCEDAELLDDKKTIRIKSKWPTEIGYLGDGNGTRCSLIAKTSSNFTYNFNNFGISGTQTSLPITEGGKVITKNVNIG